MLKSFSSYSNEPVFYGLLGGFYMETYQYDKAIEYFDKAISFIPDFPQYYYKLGLCFLKKGDNHKALENFIKAYELELLPAFKDEIKKQMKLVREQIKSSKQQ